MGRVGHKRSDRRWKDNDGHVWASKLECQVYDALRADERIAILERCDKGGSHTFDYHSPVRSALCQSCASGDVVQCRTYTPDLYVVPARSEGEARGYYLEIKGHFRPERRTLLRHFLAHRRRTDPDFDLRFILERDGRATSRLNLGEYITKYMKCQWHVWDGRLPGSWV